MIAVAETFANHLRGAAALIRMTHGPDCPDFAAHRAAAAALDDAAEVVEDGRRLTGEELRRVQTIARAYRADAEPVETQA